MDYIELILSYIMIWWVLFFCMLPIGNPKTYDEQAQMGNAASAPPTLNLKRKMAINSLLSLVVLGIVYLGMEYLPIDKWIAAWTY